MGLYKLTEQHMDRMLIPKVHWNALLSKVPNRCVHKGHVSDYVEDIVPSITSGQGLYLWGDYGRGKSGLAALILKAAASRGFIGLWLRAKELPRHVIEKTQFDNEFTMMDRALDVPILVLDEFQVRSDIRYTEVAAEDLIRARIDSKKSTIVTSNITISDISDRYPALYSVLQEGLFPIHIKGHDFRSEMGGVPN